MTNFTELLEATYAKFRQHSDTLHAEKRRLNDQHWVDRRESREAIALRHRGERAELEKQYPFVLCEIKGYDRAVAEAKLKHQHAIETANCEQAWTVALADLNRQWAGLIEALRVERDEAIAHIQAQQKQAREQEMAESNARYERMKQEREARYQQEEAAYEQRREQREKEQQERQSQREQREQQYRQQGHQQTHQQTTTKTQAPVDHKALWYAYNKKFHPNLFCNHPRYAEIEELCKQVNIAYDRRSSSFPQELARIQAQAEKIVAA